MAAKKPKYKLLFIVGFPRSGTTWTMWLLGQHPSAVVCFHSGFFHALKPVREWWKDTGGHGKSVYTYAKNNKNSKIDESKVKLNSILSLEEFYKHSRPLAGYVFDQMASCSPDTKVVVEKTPENLVFSEWILKIFPDAYILHVIRDPRSIFPSLRNAAYSWAPIHELPVAPNPIEVAKGWMSYLERGRKLSQMTDRYKEVHYEALSKNGSAELQEIYSWLNLPADQSFCDQVVEAGTLDKLRKQKGLAPKGFFRKGSAEGWRDELSLSDKKVMEYIAGDLLDEMGYELTTDRLTHKPFRLRMYEGTSKVVQKFARAPAYLSRRVSKINPLNGRLNPNKQMQVLKKTLVEMSK